MSKNIENLDSFLKPKLKIFFPDPLIFNDMEKSVERIILALKKKEKISVFGDYDVDGLSSIALIKKYFDFFLRLLILFCKASCSFTDALVFLLK